MVHPHDSSSFALVALTASSSAWYKAGLVLRQLYSVDRPTPVRLCISGTVTRPSGYDLGMFLVDIPISGCFTARKWQ